MATAKSVVHERRILLLLALGTLTLIVAAVATTSPSPAAEPRSRGESSSEQPSRIDGRADPVGDHPPAEWIVSLSAARERAPYGLLFPDHPDASVENMKAAYQVPDKPAAVSFEFPSDAPKRPLRFDGIWVAQLPWEGGDPFSNYKDDIALDPSPAKFLCEARGVPALCVNAHSPDDATGENAAFVRFVVDNIEVQLTGGESVDELIRIANTLERL